MSETTRSVITASGRPSSIERHAAKGVMSVVEWKEATKFDGTDWRWVIMSIGMAIGAGIVFFQ